MKNFSGSVDVRLSDGTLHNWAPGCEVLGYSVAAEAVFRAGKEEFAMPVLEWQKKGDKHRAQVEERTYLIVKDGNKYSLSCDGMQLTKGKLDAVKDDAQRHLNRHPPPTVTRDAAIAIAKRASKLGMLASHFCEDKKLMDTLFTDGLGVPPAVKRQAIRWQQEFGYRVRTQEGATRASEDVSQAPTSRKAAEHVSDDARPVRKAPVTKGRAKYVILGFASLGVIHWMGREGFSLEQAKKVLAAHGITEITDENLQYRLRAGTRPNANPAPLMPEQVKQLKREGGVK